MFVCEYEFKAEDMVKGTVTTMQKQPQKVRKLLLWLIPVFIAVYTAVMIFDLTKGVDITADILLLVVMLATYITLWCLPAVYKSIASKSYKSNALGNQMCNIYMDEHECVVTFSRQGKEVSRESLQWNNMTSYTQDEQYIILIFNMKFVVIKKAFLRGEQDLLLIMLDKYLKDNTQARA